MIRWTVLRRPLLSLLMLLLSSTGYQVLRGPSAAPRLHLGVTWDRSHTAPGEIVALVAAVHGAELTAPLTTTQTISLPAGTTLVEQLDTYALTCTPMTASLTCTGPLSVSSPQSAAVRLLVGDHPAGTHLVVSGVAVAGDGVTASASDVLFVQAAAPTAIPPTPTSVTPTSVTPTSITTPPLTPTVTLPATGVIPTATVPGLPTDGVPTITPAAAPSLTPTPATPSATPLPSQTPRPTGVTPTMPAPTVRPGWGPDALENNYDRTHASLLAVGEVYPNLTLVAPGGDGLGDVDYVEWFAKAGRCYTLETRDLAPGLDTNIEILDAADQVAAGNDDATPLDPRSHVTVCPNQDTMVVARIAQNTKAPLPDPRGKSYALVVTATLPPTATPEPTSIPATSVPATIPPVPSALPAVPALPLPPLPAVPAADRDDLPPLDVTLPGGVGEALGGAEPAPAPSGPTTIPCQPFLDQAAVVTDTAIFAAPESCEQILAIETLPMPTGQVRVAAMHAALYAGPGAQYARLALLPRAYPLSLTGLTRNGWVAVAIQTSGDVPPLTGWAWGASLRVVQWDSLVSVPTPTAPLVAGGPTPALPLPTSAPVGSDPGVTAGTPLTIKPRPATTRTMVVQVCRDGATAAAAPVCLPASGVGGVRLQVLSAAGDVVATGLTDAGGRWSTRLPSAPGLRVVAPLLGLSGAVSFDRAADPLVVALSLPAAVIPPAFR